MSPTIRTITLADIPLADSLLISAYSSPVSFAVELEQYFSLQPDGWFLIEDSTIPAGFGGAINYGPFAYIGLIGIHPTFQRRGLGLALMRHILSWLSQHDCPIALLEASLAGAPLYTRLGFKTTDTTLALRLDAPSIPPAIPTIPVSPLQSSDLPSLLALDTPIFGANRSRVFTTYLESYPTRCLLTHNAQGAVSGYLVAHLDGLGPWFAQSMPEAEALLAHALTLPFQHTPRIRIPASNAAALQLAARYGFREIRVFNHMQLGGSQSPQARNDIFALATAAIG